MSLEGMDVDELRGLAAQLGTDESTLSGLITTVNGIAGELVLLWNGPASVTFEQDWQSRHRPALLAALSTLSSLHTHLVNNVNQQASASAAEGGWTAERAVGDFENALTVAGLVGFPVSALAGTSKVLGATDGVLGRVGYIGAAISAYHEQEDEVHFDEALISGHYVDAANDLTDELSDGLKGLSTFVPLPYSLAAYGAGVDVKLLDEVANLDWKDTPSPFSGSNFEQDYVPEFKSMGTGAYWEQAGKTLWGAL
jgi:uncharacterized protein YukE